MSTPIQHRYDFVYFFDVTDGNPNGDPDAGNLPRIDPETNQGLVTDVCLKRKIRNFVAATHGEVAGQRIYIRERGVLNASHREAYVATEQKPEAKKLPKDEQKAKLLTDWMCKNFFDIRTFGAVMTTEVNCGQVRGPLQFTFARSISEADDDALPISGLQHLVFCPRQWALIHLEQVWVENITTAEGRLLHERADLPGESRRASVRTVRGMCCDRRGCG
jgi:Cas7 group CRISPR-associated protein Csh2